MLFKKCWISGIHEKAINRNRCPKRDPFNRVPRNAQVNPMCPIIPLLSSSIDFAFNRFYTDRLYAYIFVLHYNNNVKFILNANTCRHMDSPCETLLGDVLWLRANRTHMHRLILKHRFCF